MKQEDNKDIGIKIIEKIINVLSSETVRTIGCEALELANPVAGTLAGVANELISVCYTNKFEASSMIVGNCQPLELN